MVNEEEKNLLEGDKIRTMSLQLAEPDLGNIVL